MREAMCCDASVIRVNELHLGLLYNHVEQNGVQCFASLFYIYTVLLNESIWGRLVCYHTRGRAVPTRIVLLRKSQHPSIPGMMQMSVFSTTNNTSLPGATVATRN